jgi:hypothetical protein
VGEWLTGKYRWYTLGAAALLLFYWTQSTSLDDQIEEATGTVEDDGTTSGGGQTITIDVTVTTYHPSGYKTVAEAVREGGPTDMASRPLQTVEMFRAGQADFVSLSGDNTIFPYGQRVSLSAYPDITFRIVDTGGSFSSLYKKVYRFAGREPIDMAVNDETQFPGVQKMTMTIYPGDNMASKKPKNPAQSLDLSNVQGQDPVYT